jgi:hypothetical protein
MFREVGAHELTAGQHLRVSRRGDTHVRDTIYVVVKEIKASARGQMIIVTSYRTDTTEYKLTKVRFVDSLCVACIIRASCLPQAEWTIHAQDTVRQYRFYTRVADTNYPCFKWQRTGACAQADMCPWAHTP